MIKYLEKPINLLQVTDNFFYHILQRYLSRWVLDSSLVYGTHYFLTNNNKGCPSRIHEFLIGTRNFLVGTHHVSFLLYYSCMHYILPHTWNKLWGQIGWENIFTISPWVIQRHGCWSCRQKDFLEQSGRNMTRIKIIILELSPIFFFLLVI